MLLGKAFYNLTKAAMDMGDLWSDMMEPLFEELDLDQTEYQDILPEEKVFEFAFNSFNTNFCRDRDVISGYIEFINDSIQKIINDGLMCHNLEELIDSMECVHKQCDCDSATTGNLLSYMKSLPIPILYDCYTIGHEYLKYLDEEPYSNFCGNVGHWDVNINAYVMCHKNLEIQMFPNTGNILIGIIDRESQILLKRFTISSPCEKDFSKSFAKVINEISHTGKLEVIKEYKYTCLIKNKIGEIGYSEFFRNNIYISYKTKQIYTLDDIQDVYTIICYAGAQYKADKMYESVGIIIPLIVWCTDELTLEETLKVFSEEVDRFESCPQFYFDRDIKTLFEQEDEIKEVNHK